MADVAQKKQLKQFLNLAVVAYLDGKIEENELTFLRQKQRQLGISDDEARRVLSLVFGGKRDLSATATPEERQSLLSDVVEMALADGVIQQGEYESLASLAKRIGASEADLDKTIARISNRILNASAPQGGGMPGWLVNLFVILAVIGAVAFADLQFFWRG